MQYNFKSLAIFVAATMAGAGLASCSKGSQQQSQVASEEAPLVKVETVFDSDVAQTGVYTASVEANLVNNISSSTGGRIKEITVDEGMFVSKGETLVVLDDVNLVNYENNVATAEANLSNTQANYDRALQLYQIGGGTKQNVDAMETQLITAKNNLASARRTLQHARENTVLTAPVSGVVTARNYDPGDMTGALPILTIGTTNPVKVVCNISESDYSKVKKGMEADCTFDTYGDEVFRGVISMISPTVDAATRTFGIEVTLPNDGNRVLPGMFGRVSLNQGMERHVVVPDMAVVKQPGSGNQYIYVFNPEDSTVSYNRVELGQRIGNTYEIISGVESGSQVVVNGQSRLANGVKVRIMQDPN